jgi:hypothetical protein
VSGWRRLRPALRERARALSRISHRGENCGRGTALAVALLATALAASTGTAEAGARAAPEAATAGAVTQPPPVPPAAAPSRPADTARRQDASRQPPAPPSDRVVEVLRLDCANRLGRREVTLFGNGTIRLRDGPIGKEWMGLAELDPDELKGTLRRLGQEDLSDAADLPRGVAGDWVEKCDLVLDLPGQKRQKFFYGHYDTLPLALFHVQGIAEELAAKVMVLRDAERLPEHYEPRLDDVLKRADGARFRVVNFTSDRKGVELEGIDQPLYLIVRKEQMRMEFVALVSRAK